MKISYKLRWNPKTGTAYRQTVRISEAENRSLFNSVFSLGVNYGNAYTGSYIAAAIHACLEYKKQVKRILPNNNTIVFVGSGTIPVYGKM